MLHKLIQIICLEKKLIPDFNQVVKVNSDTFLINTIFHFFLNFKRLMKPHARIFNNITDDGSILGTCLKGVEIDKCSRDVCRVVRPI